MLVVEDDPRSRKLLEGYLHSEGYLVQGAGDGSAGLEQAFREVPDVVLLDVMMPGMTGYEVCARLKRDPRTRLSQVMLVTALAGTPDKVAGLDTGADDYVTKPVRREEFLAKVRALLRARRLLVELETARAAVAARNEELQLKKTLAQTLVHDLKNPLSAILGNLQLLELKCDPGLHYLIERGKRGADRMRQMILNLLDVEALEEGKLEPRLGRIDLAAVALDAVEEAAVAAAQAKIEVECDVPEHAWAHADAALVRRVVDNLLANAITYTPDGGRIEVTVCPRPEGIEISVADTGPGIPPEHREQIFEKYAQLELKEAGISGNRGLGLTFCRLAVEVQGGTIWVEAAAMGGACFRTLLPDARDVAEAAADVVPARG
jgi:signal transduction histidine kinase